MKTIKFGITLLSAVMMIPSQMAWAAFDSNQKTKFNTYLKQNFTGTFGDLYRNHAYIFDGESRGLMEAWLRQYGKKDLPKPQAMIIRDKSGRDTLKLVFNNSGRTLTLTFTEGDYQTFDVNGKRMAFSEVRNIQNTFDKLAESDSTLAPIAKSMKTSTIPVPRKQEYLSVNQFAKLSKLQRVEYMQLLRQNVEAAQEVFDQTLTDRGQAQLPASNSPLYVFHPLFAAQIAWAAANDIPRENDKCIVAGNVSVYEKEGGRLACSPFPKKNPQGFQPQPTFHNRCTSKGKGPMVACNPLLYGADQNGAPFCVDSGNQPHFTMKATADCNKLSPLHPDANSKDRRGDYERILKSYYLLNGNSAESMKGCFNDDHKLDPNCKILFETQYNDFLQFKQDAEQICKTVKLKDQNKACKKLEERALGLIEFMETINNVPDRPPVVAVNIEAENCAKVPGAYWDPDIQDCICPNHKRAVSTPGIGYECPAQTNPPTPPVAVEKKDECKNDDGKQKNSFKCNPAPWLMGIAAVGAFAWLMCRDKDKPPQKPIPGTGPGPGGPSLPPPSITYVPGTTPTVTVPPTTPTPTTPTLPPSDGEGGKGKNPNTGAGGVR